MDSCPEVPRRETQQAHLHQTDVGSPPPTHKHSSSFQTLETKIGRAKKRIGEEQRRRDANVEEYLKMAAVAQRNQLPQVKALFEKRNTKAATHIAGLQRKLERYTRDLQVGSIIYFILSGKNESL
jgi:rubrerythrin